jgi:hypothetical protein
MEAWSLHMLGTGLMRSGRVDEARAHLVNAMRLFHAAGDAAGITMVLGDLSAIAVADGAYPRAARLRGAARNLTAVTGAQLADRSEELLEGGRPSVRAHVSEADLVRYGAEGATRTLDQAVAYALEGSDPTDPGQA